MQVLFVLFCGYFNSTMVRLKVLGIAYILILFAYFNSTMVRLKAIGMTGKQK